jgi:uncharacterized protein
MKILLFLVAVVVLLYMLRGSARRMRQPTRDDPNAPSKPPQAMLTCAFCGTHMPRDEALPGRGGVFCDEAHRTAFEKANPSA